MNVEIRTRRASGAACREKSISSKGRLRGRSARDTESARCFEIEAEVFSGCESRDGKRCLRRDLDRRLRNRGASDVADLAMLLVVGVTMPVGDHVDAQ